MTHEDLGPSTLPVVGPALCRTDSGAALDDGPSREVGDGLPDTGSAVRGHVVETAGVPRWAQ
jgi:hypothetical protein